MYSSRKRASVVIVVRGGSRVKGLFLGFEEVLTPYGWGVLGSLT